MDPQAFHDFEHAGWQRAAARYIDAFSMLTRQTAEPLLDAVRVNAGTRLLDVATGPGFIAAAAHARGAIVVGLDFSRAMIAAARASHPSIEFREGDAEALPFETASFDAVVMNFGMLHLARPETAIAEARRVLRRGGRFAFTVWGPPEAAVGFGIVNRAIADFGTPDIGLPEGPPFFQFSDASACERTLAAAGFDDVDVATLPLSWRVPAPDAVFAAVTDGGVRTSAVLRAQTPEALAQIRAAVRRGVEAYATSDGTLAIPMLVILASATCATTADRGSKGV